MTRFPATTGSIAVPTRRRAARIRASSSSKPNGLSGTRTAWRATPGFAVCLCRNRDAQHGGVRRNCAVRQPADDAARLSADGVNGLHHLLLSDQHVVEYTSHLYVKHVDGVIDGLDSTPHRR